MTDWTSLGTPPPGISPGSRASNFPVASNQDGRLEVFTIGGDGALWHIWQAPNGPNDGWSDWASLGGPPDTPPRNTLFFVAVGVNADGHLEVFAFTSYALWHIWQALNGPNDGWSDWASLGSSEDSTDALTVAANADGRLEVFASGSYGALWHIWQAPNDGWSDWASLGRPQAVVPPSSYLLSPVAVGRNQDGRLEVFATNIYNGGTQWGVWHIWQLTGGGWGQWESLQTLPVSEPGQSSPPVVRANQDGRLEVFLTSGDGTLWHRWQVFPSQDVWNPEWRSLGKPTGQTGEASFAYPAVGINNDGRLEAFINGSDKALWHIWQAPNGPNDGWSNWASLGIPPNLTSVGFTPSVGVNADGRLEVFITGSDNTLWHIWQVTPNGGWG